MARFPSIQALASAPEEAVIASWRGLGYYRRARNLHLAARAICHDHGGVVPTSEAELRALPGIGHYTAGAIGSIGHGQKSPIVDGNVARVLMRVHGRDVDSTSSEGRQWLWSRAREFVEDSRSAGAANEGLMELGAMVCTPLNARCTECPIRKYCKAAKAGAQDRIPTVRKRRARKVVHAQVIIARIGGRTALVRRPTRGLWARMLFPPTIESDRVISKGALARRLGVAVDELHLGESFTFLATHREVRFRLWIAGAAASKVLKASHANEWTWHSRKALARASHSSAMSQLLGG